MTNYIEQKIRRYQFLKFMKHYRQHHSVFYREYQRTRNLLKKLRHAADDWAKKGQV